MAFTEAYGPSLPTFADLKNHLREEPLYLQVLEKYLRNTANLAKLESSEREAPNVEEVGVPRGRPATPANSATISRTSRSVPSISGGTTRSGTGSRKSKPVRAPPP
uniref:Uncharacterized protein n=1 Tax=Loa loa TaxID=7209 RepID=A0A1I7VYD9_LOALO